MSAQRKRRSDGGQSLVEFALVVPLFLLFVFAIVDGGRAIFAYNGTSQAARNVARVASVNCLSTVPIKCDQSSGAIKAAIEEQSVNLPGPRVWTVECVDSDWDTPTGFCFPGDRVRVTVSTTFDLITPVASNAFGTVGVTSTSQLEILR